MSDRKPVECWLTDMDGVLVHEEQALPGAPSSSPRCSSTTARFLVLTNNSIFTARDLRARLLAQRDRRPGELPSGPRPWPPRSSWPTSAPAARRT